MFRNLSKFAKTETKIIESTDEEINDNAEILTTQTSRYRTIHHEKKNKEVYWENTWDGLVKKNKQKKTRRWIEITKQQKY